MNMDPATGTIFDLATRIASSGDASCAETLDALPAPIYVTDAKGVIRYHTPACAEFAGRAPRVGKDAWCVTWKLHTKAGEDLPHDQCPMAVAIKEQRPVRGEGAVAERPDGSRVAFEAFPTPLFDEKGDLAGAINMLVTPEYRKHIRGLHEQASNYRRLAAASDKRTANTLNLMAAECQVASEALEQLMN